MKKNLITYLTILLPFLLFSQYSKEFNDFSEKLTAIDTVYFAKKYKVEGQKETGTYLNYENEDYIYQFAFGKWKYFYRQNVIMKDFDYDNFGHALNWKVYYFEGDLLEKSEIISIGTTAKNLSEFLNINHRFCQVLTFEKNYKYSKKMKKSYLFAEGQKLNNKKIGKWIKYHENGELKSEKTH
jgi:hypothetical protein